MDTLDKNDVQIRDIVKQLNNPMPPFTFKHYMTTEMFKNTEDSKLSNMNINLNKKLKRLKPAEQIIDIIVDLD